MFRYAQSDDDDGLDGFLDRSGARPSRRTDPALIGGVEPVVPGRRPRRFQGFRLPAGRGLTGPLLAGAMMVTVGGNALFMQDGPHPAPLFAQRAPSTAQAAASRNDPAHDQATPQTVASIPLPTARPGRVEAASHEASAPLQTGEIVQEAQRLLTELGYYQGEADGIAGPVTIGALKRYEGENGLVAAGDINEAIVDHLRLKASRRETATARAKGDSIGDLVEKTAESAPPVEFDEAIAEVQRVLAMLGYSPGSIDGQLGPGTREAIMRFRKDNGLPVVDVIDTMLIHALQEFSGVELARGA
ncbi:MAG: peptidoglycan-binding protein [Flavobacteriaceae bacterium]